MRQRIDRGLSAKPLVRDGHILHSIIDGSFIPTFVIDREHRVLYWNRALEEISKIAASSVIGTKRALAGILLGAQALHGGSARRRGHAGDPAVVCRQTQGVHADRGGLRGHGFLPRTRRKRALAAIHGVNHPQRAGRDRRRRGDSRGHYGPEARRGGAQGEPAAALPDPRRLTDRGVCDRPGPPGDLLEPGA